jgi:hypothetical protein
MGCHSMARGALWLSLWSSRIYRPGACVVGTWRSVVKILFQAFKAGQIDTKEAAARTVQVCD